MAVEVLHAATIAAINAALAGANGTRESGVALAIGAAFGASPVTVKVFSSSDVLLCTLTLGAMTVDTASAQKKVTPGARTAYTFSAAGTPAHVVWANGATDILRIGAGVGSGDLSFLAAIAAGVPVSLGPVEIRVAVGLDSPALDQESSKYRTGQPLLFLDVAVGTQLDESGSTVFTPPRPELPTPKTGYEWSVHGPRNNRVCIQSEWSWQNVGGDWINAAGTPQATTFPHFSFAANAVTSGSHTYTVDITSGVQAAFAGNRWNAYIVRATGGTRSIASQHHATLTKPSVFVTYDDDTTETLACTACTQLANSTSYSRIGRSTAPINPSVAIEFRRPAKAITSATLTITITSHTATACTVNGYLANPPVTSATVTNGIAAAYPLDNGIASDPSILFSHRYQDGATLTDFVATSLGVVDIFTASNWSPDLYGAGAANDNKLPVSFNGNPIAGKWLIKNNAAGHAATVSYVESGHTGDGFVPVAPGIGALRIITPKSPNPDGTFGPSDGMFGSDLVALFPKDISGLVSELYVRFYVRFVSAMKTVDQYKMYGVSGSPTGLVYQQPQGKWGVGAHHWTRHGGNNRQGGDNLGWTNRLVYIQPPANLEGAGIHCGIHSLDMLPSQTNMMWGLGGGMGASLYPDRWYCVEVRIKLNTWNPAGGSPADGVMQTWIDGVLVDTHTGWSYRDGPLDYVTATPPATGMPPFRELGATGLLLNHYQGGVIPTSEDFIAYYSLIAAGTEYIGPANLDVALPAWVPAPGELKNMVSGGSAHILDNVKVSYPSATYGSMSLSRALRSWNSGCFLAENGARGTYYFIGGGHSDYTGNEVYAFDVETRTWSVAWGPSAGLISATNPNPLNAYQEYPDGAPAVPHTYDHLVAVPPSAGFPKGRLVLAGRAAAGYSAEFSTGYAAVLDLDTLTWSRSTNEPTGLGAAEMSAIYDPVRNVIWRFGNRGATSKVARLDLSTMAWQAVQNISESGSPYIAYDFVSGYCPTKDVIVSRNTYNGAVSQVLVFHPVTLQRVVATTSGTGPTQSDHTGIEWCPLASKFYLYKAGSSSVWTLTPPAGDPLSGTWVWGVETFAAGSDTPSFTAVTGGTGEAGSNYRANRWRWAPDVKSFVWFDSIAAPAQLYRPIGT